MNRRACFTMTLVITVAVSLSGCQSPYRADQGALFGGLLGAGTGAIIGQSLGNAGAGAAIGAGVGALSGAVIGSELDAIEAQNRAAIAQHLGREVSANAVTLSDVVEMTSAGVNEELIVNHVRAHGIAAPLQTSDLIFLQQQNVSTRVIKAMQEPPPRPVRTVMVREAPPVVIHEYPYGPPACGPYYNHHSYGRRHSRHRSHVDWGFSFH